MLFRSVALRGCAAFLSNYCMAWVGNHVVMRLQQQVFSHLMAMPMSFFDRQNTGNLLSKVTYDAGQVSSAASSTRPSGPPSSTSSSTAPGRSSPPASRGPTART